MTGNDRKKCFTDFGASVGGFHLWRRRDRWSGSRMAVVMSHGVGGYLPRVHTPAHPLKFCSSRGACILVIEYPLLPSNSELHI